MVADDDRVPVNEPVEPVEPADDAPVDPFVVPAPLVFPVVGCDEPDWDVVDPLDVPGRVGEVEVGGVLVGGVVVGGALVGGVVGG